MKTQNIKEFLLEIDSEELKNRGILRGALNLLQGASVDPLIGLMKECVSTYKGGRCRYGGCQWLAIGYENRL